MDRPEWVCLKCPLDAQRRDLGPWTDDNSSIFKNVKATHEKHPGWQCGTIPKSGKQQIEEAFTDKLNETGDKFKQIIIESRTRRADIGLPIKQIEVYHNSKVKHDAELVRLIERAGFSAYTNNPINLGIMATSSEGKTHAVTKVLEDFPKGDVLFLADMSPTALIHDKGVLVDEEDNEPIQGRLDAIDKKIASSETPLSKEEKSVLEGQRKALIADAVNLIDLNGKIIVFLDAPDIELWNKLKSILSHDRYELTFKTTNKSQSKGLGVKTAILRGWPACVFCSAKNEKQFEQWHEVETRFIIKSPVTAPEKYKAANKLTGNRYSIPEFASGIYHSKHDQEFCRRHILDIKDSMITIQNDPNQEPENKVINLFDYVISEKFPNDEGVMMRNMNRLYSLINVETLINTENRPKFVNVTINEEDIEEKAKYPLTAIEDIQNAIDLMGSNHGIPPQVVKFFRDVFELVESEQMELQQTEYKGITTKQLAEKYHTVYKKEINPKKDT